MKLLLVDGHSLAYRAFFAMPPLSNSKGQPTQAVLGTANMIFRILKEENPTHMIVFFDRGIPKFRRDAYEAYKAQRPETPDDLESQLPLLKEFFQALNIKVIEEPEFEADDWIATAVNQAEQVDSKILILSGDLDMLQLVSEKTAVLVSKKGISQLTRYDRAEVEKRYGLAPSQLIDLKALMGDTSDNIRGVPGIGEKGAMKLLQEWGSLESLMQNKDKLPPKIRSALSSSEELLKRNRQLVTLRRDAPLELRPEAYTRTTYEPAELRNFLEKMEFRNLMTRLELTSQAHFENVDFQPVESEEALNTMLTQFHQSTEAGLLIWPLPSPFLEKQFLGVELPNRGRWIVSQDYTVAALRGLTQHSSPKKISTYNWKAFLLAFQESSISAPAWDVEDVLIEGWLCNSLRTNPSIPELANDHLGKSLPESSENLPSLLAHWVSALCPLGLELNVKIQALQLESLYRNLELPLIPVLAAMEHEGVAIDLPYLQQLSQEFKSELSGLEGEIYREAGMMFNINSPKQMAEVLYGKLNLPKGKKTKTGFSTNVDELERLALDSLLAKRLLEYRELAKLLNTYIEVFPKIVDPARHRLHTTYLQTGTATGRLSSKDPNLQNIPIRTEIGRKIRKAFTAGKPGWKMLSADYSQIELRLLAHFSKDPVLLEAFSNNEDIHARTASELFNVSPEQVTPEMRRMAKVVNFGIIYGMTEHGLSQNLGMKREEARDYITKYLNRFPQVEAYIQASIATARESGVTRTLFNRIRPVLELQSPKSYLRQQAERIGINAPLQGTVADLMKLAMIAIDKKIKEGGFQALMVMQVHDELVFEVKSDEVERLLPLIKNEMENVIRLDVPLLVDVSLGENWAEMERL